MRSESKNLNKRRSEVREEGARIRLSVTPLLTIWGQYGIFTRDGHKQKAIFWANLNLGPNFVWAPKKGAFHTKPPIFKSAIISELSDSGKHGYSCLAQIVAFNMTIFKLRNIIFFPSFLHISFCTHTHVYSLHRSISFLLFAYCYCMRILVFILLCLYFFCHFFFCLFASIWSYLFFSSFPFYIKIRWSFFSFCDVTVVLLITDPYHLPVVWSMISLVLTFFATAIKFSVTDYWIQNINHLSVVWPMITCANFLQSRVSWNRVMRT